MDRNKHGGGGSKRGSKSKSLAHLHGDLIALGAKGTSSDSKHISQNKPSGSGLIKSDAGKKGDSSVPALFKKHKPSTVASLGGASTCAASGSDIDRRAVSSSANRNEPGAWHTVAVEPPPPADLPAVIASADVDRAEALICGCVRWQLAPQRSKHDPVLCAALMLLAKSQPAAFCSEHVISALCSLLRRETPLLAATGFKTRTASAHAQVLAVNILLSLFRDENHWPEVFISVYLEDAAGERVWVDSEECRVFVENVLTAFGTRQSPRSLLQPDITLTAARSTECPSPPVSSSATDEDWSSETPQGSSSVTAGASCDVESVRPRYSRQKQRVRDIVVEFVQEAIGTRKQPVEAVSRNIIRLLAGVCGVAEVRQRVVYRLELWLQNPKWSRPAQELLVAVCCNAVSPQLYDSEVISQLVRYRLKAKPIINLYLGCMRELLAAHEDNLPALLRHTIYNELSQVRNPHNMAVLAVIFQHAPRLSAAALAEVFLELLMNVEDYYQRALRPLWREICRSLRYEVDFQHFCSSLLQERRDEAFREFEFRERYITSICDLVALSILLSISPAVKESAALRSADSRDHSSSAALVSFHAQAANIQCAVLQWLHVSVPQMTPTGWSELTHCVYRVLFMEPVEVYHRIDNWPPENERSLLIRIASDVPANQETLLRVLLIGLSKTHALPPANALEVADNLVRRSAMCHQMTDGVSTLDISKLELVDLLFNLSMYQAPDTITLPADYSPPSLAVQESYWRVWLILLLVVAHNPQHFGKMAWMHYHTLRMLIEMCITNSFVFPPLTAVVGDGAGSSDEILAKELQLHALEKHAIIEYESHLAAGSTGQTITESNSLLLSQLIALEPTGAVRRPPTIVLEQLRHLNSQLRVGQLLCTSRQPDFLLDILQRHGSSQSTPWLSDLVTNSDGSFSRLPVQCLCEFLLSVMASDAPSDSTDDDLTDQLSQLAANTRHAQLLTHLQTLVQRPETDERANFELIEYFLRRLSSQRRRSRLQATRSFKVLLTPAEGSDKHSKAPPFSWLLQHLPAVPNFAQLRAGAVHGLRIACHYETNSALVAAYIEFLAAHGSSDPLAELGETVADLAQLIVERSSIMALLLPSSSTSKLADTTFSSLLLIFSNYMKKLRTAGRIYSWSDDNPEQVIVRWTPGETYAINCLVVHATVILLCCPQPSQTTASAESYHYLQQLWLPTPPTTPPHTLDGNALFPDWLRLRMVRGANISLVEAALEGLQPSQLVLFIQSFGVPVSSMSRLLHALDTAVEHDSTSVLTAVMNRQYMCQLVEVQRRRGAAGGHKFASVLQQHLPADAISSGDPRTVSIPAPPQPFLSPTTPPVTALAPSQVLWFIRDLFAEMAVENTGCPQQQHRLRSLERGVAMESRDDGSCLLLTRAAVSALNSLLTENGCGFVEQMHRRSSVACCLLRLLTDVVSATSPSLADDLVSVCCRLVQLSETLSHLPDKSDILLDICKRFCRSQKRRRRHKKCANSPVADIKTEPVESDNCADETSSSFQSILVDSDTVCAERQLSRYVKTSVSQARAGALVVDISRCLLQSISREDLSGKVGLLVDWLEILEPDIIGRTCDSAQLLMLFGATGRHTNNRAAHHMDVDTASEKSSSCGVTAGIGSVSYRSYLLSLLAHRADWHRLQSTIEFLLTSAPPELLVERYDAAVVLDFVQACRHVPRLWQGRERTGSVANSCRGLVVGHCLERSVSLVHYMVHEAASVASTAGAGEASCHRLKERLPLLLLMCCGDEESGDEEDDRGASSLLSLTVRRIVALRDNCSRLSSDEGKQLTAASDRLIVLLYLQLPRIVYQLPPQLLEKAVAVDQGELLAKGVSSADPMSHTLLTAIAATRNVKEGLVCMRNYETCLRKMAATHPHLLMRQLPMMAALLHGRVDVNTAVFRRRNEAQLFSRLLGVLRLLLNRPMLHRPMKLSSVQSECVADLLEIFVSAVEQHHLPPQLQTQRDLAAVSVAASLVNPLCSLIAECGKIAPFAVHRLLCRHKQLFSALASRHGGEHPLLRSLAALSGGSDHDFSRINALPDLNHTEASPTQISALRLRLNTVASSDELLAVLRELDIISSPRGAQQALGHFVDDLCAHVTSNFSDVRSLSHHLLRRYLCQNPADSGRCVNAYLRCLSSENESVRLAVIQLLPRLVVLCRRDSCRILLETFDVALNSGVDVTNYVCEALSCINLQWGM